MTRLYDEYHNLGLAKVQNIRQINKSFCQSETRTVSEFRGKFESDEETSLNFLEDPSVCKEEKLDMLRIIVDSRKNVSILNMLDRTEPRDIGMDQTLAYKKAVLWTTLNNDPDSLASILDWGTGKQEIQNSIKSSVSIEDDPIVLCSLENNKSCLGLLYNAGFRISLDQEDEKRITAVIELNIIHSKNMQIKLFERQNCDPIERFLRFQAHANPTYTAVAFVGNETEMKTNPQIMRNLDPIRRSFAISEYAKELSSQFPDYCEGYLKIRSRCDEFTKQVLEHCNSNDDVKKLLDSCPSDVASERTNLHMALWQEHKDFVSHPFFQQYKWERMTMDIKLDSYNLLKKIKIFLISICLFPCYPFVVLLDSLFRENNILFLSPEKLQISESLRNISNEIEMEKSPNGPNLEDNIDMEESPNGQDLEDKLCESETFAFFRKSMHTPIYKMFVYMVLDVVFFISIFLHINDAHDGMSTLDNSYYPTIIAFIFATNHLFENIVDIQRLGWSFLSSVWSIYSLLTNLLLCTCGLTAWISYQVEVDDVNRASLSGNNQLNIAMTMVSLGASMSFFRITRVLLLHRKIGPVVICIVEIMKDVLYVCVIFLIIYFAFSAGVWSMFKPFQNCNENESQYCLSETRLLKNQTYPGILSLLFWKVFDGDFSNAEIRFYANRSEDDNSTSDGVISHGFSHLMGLAFLAGYQGLTVIILINVLIAMMNSTYSKIWENSDKEWKYSKSFYQVQFFRPRETFPPPFRWIYYFAHAMRKIKMCKKSCPENQEDSNNRSKDYIQLMMRLVKTKLHSEEENSIDDKFKNLKMDIFEKIEEMKKSFSK